MTENLVEFEISEAQLCSSALHSLNNDALSGIEQQIRIQLGTQMPELDRAFDLIKNALKALGRMAASSDTSVSIPDRFMPVIKVALSMARKKEAGRAEIRSQKTNNPSALSLIRETLDRTEALLNDERLTSIEPMRIPRLTDFLTIQQAENALFGGGAAGLRERSFDEKFNILLAPSLIAGDIAQLRLRCSLRNAPLSVAFVDIDDFKQFNLKYSEPIVDEIVLPSFMSVLEAHVFERGYAYRQGGDEYIVICPNLTAEQTGLLFSEFQVKLEELELKGIGDKISVSVGVCAASPECQLTDRELVRFASKAKQAAKDLGKHRVAGYTDPTYDQEPVDLSVQ